ncbi:hypothetical protein PAGL106935_03430 [Paenibacillus glucanolyticus]
MRGIITVAMPMVFMGFFGVSSLDLHKFQLS